MDGGAGLLPQGKAVPLKAVAPFVLAALSFVLACRACADGPQLGSPENRQARAA